MAHKSATIQILDELLREKTRFLNRLRRFVELETPPHDARAHLDFFSLLNRDLKKLGYRTEQYAGRESGGQLLARLPKPSSGGYQLLLGHIDTVWPKGTLQNMPFRKEKNRISGPGIYDMKAGILMMLTALRFLQSNGQKMELQPILFINSDEETGSTESVDRIMKIARAVRRVYVLEPSLDPDGKLKTRRKGVGHFDIRIKGVSAHAGIEPEKGRSAILELSYLIQKLQELNRPEEGITVNVGKIDGGTGSNVVAAESKASVDVRVETKKDAEIMDKAIRSIQSTMEGVTLEISGGFKRPPLVQNRRNRQLWQAASGIAENLGLELKEGISGGGSDGSYTSLHTATLDGLGAVGEGAHSPTEKIFFDETLERIALLSGLLKLPDLSEES